MDSDKRWITNIIIVIFCILWMNYNNKSNNQLIYLQSYKKNSNQNKCYKILENITHGPEDIALSKYQSLLFISSHDRRNMTSLGNIYLYLIYIYIYIYISKYTKSIYLIHY